MIEKDLELNVLTSLPKNIIPTYLLSLTFIISNPQKKQYLKK